MLQVVEYLLDYYRILDAGNDFHWATTRLASLDVDVKHPLEPLSPCHRRLLLCWWFTIGYYGLVASTSRACARFNSTRTQPVTSGWSAGPRPIW